MRHSLKRFRSDEYADRYRGCRRGSVRLGLWAPLIWIVVGGIQAASFSEVEVRAVYLFNFAAFIDWPAAAFESPSSPLRYCVLGSWSLRTKLEQVVSGERIEGHPLRVVEAQDPMAWRGCHVLYLDHSAQERQREVLAAVQGVPVLTVGDTEAFARTGGMVGLVRKGGRVRTLINREATARAGIQVSSKLLRLSTLVSDEDASEEP